MTYAEVEDWINGIELLSLDFTRPVYNELGVRVARQESLRRLTRDALLGWLPNQDRPFQIDELGDPNLTHTKWIEPLLGAIERALGLDDRLRIEHWVKYVACLENRNPWSLYEDILSSWAASFRRTGVDALGLSADAATIAGELKSALDLAGPKRILMQQRDSALSDWDLPRFTRLGLLEIPEGSEFFPFVDAILLIIGMNRFQEFWRWMASFITASDVDAIGSAAEKKASERKIVYCAPRELK